jgi:hypothetical protein
MSVLDFYPYRINHPIPFSDINVGEVFSIGPERYKLLRRDAFSVTVLRWFKIYDWVLALFGRVSVQTGREI